MLPRRAAVSLFDAQLRRLWLRSGEWRLAVAERPVFAPGFDQIDDDVFAANAGRGREILDNRPVERLLLLDGAPLGAGDLDHDQVGRVLDPQERGWPDHAACGGMTGHDLEIVVGWNIKVSTMAWWTPWDSAMANFGSFPSTWEIRTSGIFASLNSI
jgi:hypothetical protein